MIWHLLISCAEYHIMRKKTDDILKDIFEIEIKYISEETNKFKDFWGKSSS